MSVGALFVLEHMCRAGWPQGQEQDTCLRRHKGASSFASHKSQSLMTWGRTFEYLNEHYSWTWSFNSAHFKFVIDLSKFIADESLCAMRYLLWSESLFHDRGIHPLRTRSRRNQVPSLQVAGRNWWWVGWVKGFLLQLSIYTLGAAAAAPMVILLLAFCQYNEERKARGLFLNHSITFEAGC